MNQLIAIYRFATLRGDGALTTALAPHLRSNGALSVLADRDLRALQRGPARWSPGAEEAVARTLARTIESE